MSSRKDDIAAKIVSLVDGAIWHEGDALGLEGQSVATLDQVEIALNGMARWADSHRPTCESCKLIKECSVLEHVQRRNMGLANGRLLKSFGCNHYEEGE